MPNYKIMFPQGCGEFKMNDVVEGDRLGDVNYLLRVGAIEETEEKLKQQASGPDLSAAISKAKEESADEISALTGQVEKDSKTIKELTKKLKASNKALEKATGKPVPKAMALGDSAEESEEEVEEEETEE